MDISSSWKLRSLARVSQHKLAAVLNDESAGKSPRNLHLDPSLIKPFERICGATWLRQNGINKIFKTGADESSSTDLNRIYLIPSCLLKLKYILDQINGLLSQNPNHDGASIVIIVVPKLLTVYETLVEEEGLYGIVTLKSFQWEFICLDNGVMSLELPCMFKNLFVNKDATLLSCISSSLWRLFLVVGLPRLFVSLGKQSSSVLEMYDVFCETFSVEKQNDSEFGALLIVDRDQDYASSLLTPATYSGLLHEIFSINCGDLELDTKNTKYQKGKLTLQENKKESDKKISKMTLDSNLDNIYSEIRYLHFSSVFPILSMKAKDLNKEGSKMSTLQLEQMKHLISTKLQEVIGTKMCLSNHIQACETIVSQLGDKFEDIQIVERSLLYNKNRKSNLTHLEESVCTDGNMYTLLKLLCLLTLTQGITGDEYNSFVTKYLHAFGYKYLYVFSNLISAGLLIPPPVSKFQLGIPNISSISEKLPRWQNNFQVTANKLKQLPNDEEIVVKEPTCPSFVFNGSYVPLIAALAKILLTSENVTELTNKLSVVTDIKIGGPVIDNLKSGIDGLSEKLSNGDIDIACRDLKTIVNHLKSEDLKTPFIPLRPKSLLIYIVGGVTQAEIAACNLIEKLTDSQIVIASDSIISSENLMQSAM